jgi:hypothetical protein
MMANKTIAQTDNDTPPIQEEPKADGGGEKPIDVKPMTSDGKPTPPKKEHKPPDDALDLDSLWLDPSLGDGLVDTHRHSVAIGKPKSFFRVHPDPAYRRRTSPGVR